MTPKNQPPIPLSLWHLVRHAQHPQGGLGVASQIIVINVFAMLITILGLLYFSDNLTRTAASHFQLMQQEAARLEHYLKETPCTQAGCLEGLNPVYSATVMDKTGENLAAFTPRWTPAQPALPASSSESRFAQFFDTQDTLPVYTVSAVKTWAQEAKEPQQRIWRPADEAEGLILTLAQPVSHSTNTLILTQTGDGVAAALSHQRTVLLGNFALMFIVTTVLALYLAQTIARPLKKLAKATRQARLRIGEMPHIPDYAHRGDEIGALSLALKSTTQALWNRLNAIEVFAADVSHELKNPLTSMKSALETLPLVKDEERQNQLMAILHNDVERMQRLITDIAAASRLEGEMGRTSASVFNLTQLVAALVNHYHQNPRPHQPIIDFHTQQAQMMVQGVPTRLVQVMENLLSNAFSFSPPHKPIIFRLFQEADEAVLYVENDGAPLPVGKEDKIFERFFSLRNDETPVSAPSKHGDGHSGLGLAICKAIIESHGGTISARNKPDGQGVRFTVRLPLMG